MGRLDEVHHPEWRDCLRLVSDAYELLIPLQFGIRILHFGWAGGENLFWTEPSPTAIRRRLARLRRASTLARA
jgi:hypothetical protein